MTVSMNDSFQQKVRVISPISGATRHPAGPSDGSGEFGCDGCSRQGFPAAVAEFVWRFSAP